MNISTNISGSEYLSLEVAFPRLFKATTMSQNIVKIATQRLRAFFNVMPGENAIRCFTRR